jgi:hypothetical protein
VNEHHHLVVCTHIVYSFNINFILLIRAPRKKQAVGGGVNGAKSTTRAPVHAGAWQWVWNSMRKKTEKGSEAIGQEKK